MYSLRHIFLRVLRTPTTYRCLKHIELDRKFVSTSCRCFYSKQIDGFNSRDDYDDDDGDDVGFSGRREQRTRPNTGFQQSYGRSQGNFQSRQRRSSSFDEYEGDDDSFRGNDFRNSRYSASDLGANLKKKVWNTSQLTPLEKNFYVEHPSAAQKSEDDVNAFYKSHNITVKRGQRPIPVSHFNEANFPEEINQRLVKNEWDQPTPIQSLGWPLALSGKNMVGIAQTGSGKTLAFILPALVHIKHQGRVAKGDGPIVLVMAPTRELAQQIKEVAVGYGRLLGIRTCCLFGGQSKLIQSQQLSEGPEIVVATPGRLLDFMQMGVINLDRTSYVVLDEADRMLDMGFEPQIRKVLDQIRPDRQMLMWSATWPKEIQQLAYDFLGEFTQVNIGSVELMANPNIHQKIHVCERNDKFEQLVNELESSGKEEDQKTLIFAQTKSQSDFLATKLNRLGFKTVAIHGDKTQMMRDKALRSFKSGHTQILVATDVASRGLDVNDIKLVINYDYPNTADDYIHRIGRTARAAKTGTALTFITSEEADRADDLIKVLKDAGQAVPDDLIQLSRSQTRGNTRGPSKFNRYPNNGGMNRRNSW